MAHDNISLFELPELAPEAQHFTTSFPAPLLPFSQTAQCHAQIISGNT
jgi:hypothetical protein